LTTDDRPRTADDGPPTTGNQRFAIRDKRFAICDQRFAIRDLNLFGPQTVLSYGVSLSLFAKGGDAREEKPDTP
ncbi:MAG: hypothetical protein ACPLTQ_04765, partial [Anaerolineae bacterium]